MPRFSRECIITEKIDGTNASVAIVADGGQPFDKAICSWHQDGESWSMLAGSRTHWITPKDDNYGFARWVEENQRALMDLGPGNHFGEWWGCGIQRGYGMTEKRWSLFNVARWCLHSEEPKRIVTADLRIEKYQMKLPACCHLVPVLYRGNFDTYAAETVLLRLESHGSYASPGFMNPEGIVIYHIAGNVGFKKTIEKDGEPKAVAARAEKN
jgi:hypothetical protein